MTAPKLKLSIEQGTTFKKTITWKAGTPPVPVNLTGAKARMQIREDLDSPTVLLTLTTENGGIEIDTVLGEITLFIPASTTAAITWESAVYDLEILLPAHPEPDVRRLLRGSIRIAKEVTRD